MTSRRARMTGWLQLLFVVTVVGGAILLSVALKPDTSDVRASGSPKPLSVSVIEPERIEYEPVVSLNGVVEARTLTDVIPEVGGRVIDVSDNFRPGGLFRAGDFLFRIDPADYELAIERTLAEIEAARSELALLEAQAAAEQQIWDQQFAERKIPDLIAKVPQIAAAKARIHSGEAAREAAELALRRTVVRAPFDGRVLDTRLDVGQVVGAGASVGSVFSSDSLEISVPVSGAQLALLGDAIGLEATILRESAPADSLAAEVVRQSAALDERTRLATLFIAAESDAGLVLGEFVAVEVRGKAQANVLRVPAAAMTSKDQVWIVEDGVLRERKVEVVGTEDGFAVVRSFDTGDGLVVIPPSNGGDGLPVTTSSERRMAAGGGSFIAAD